MAVLSWSTAMLMATILSQNDFSARYASAVMNCRFLEDVETQHHRTTCGSRGWHPQRSNRRGRENRQELSEYFDTNRQLGVVVKGFLHHNHAGGPRVLGGSRISLRSVGRTLWMKLSSPCRLHALARDGELSAG